APAGPDDLVGPLRTHGRHRDVDRHLVPQRLRPLAGGRLEGAPEPRLGDGRRVLQERAPLPPPPFAVAAVDLDQGALADGDPPEPGPHGEGEDVEPHETPPCAARSRSRRRSTLPLSSSGSSSRSSTWRGAQERGCGPPTQARSSASV